MAMGARLFTLQVLERPTYARLATQQRQHVITFPPQRGSIFDRNGQPLAISINAQMIYADPLLVNDAHSESLKLAGIGVRNRLMRGALLGYDPGNPDGLRRVIPWGGHHGRQ